LWAPESAGPTLRLAAAEAKGGATLFIAPTVDYTGDSTRFEPLKPPLDGIHQRLKAEFDPAGIFNRARLYPDF
jgi:glycolate oxidase FAD binding subunit